MTKVIEALGVAVVILLLLLALQGKTIKGLREDIDTKDKALTEAYKSLERVQKSSDVTVHTVETACSLKDALDVKKDIVVKKIRGTSNAESSNDIATVELSNSMWMAYCDGQGSSVDCSSRQFDNGK